MSSLRDRNPLRRARGACALAATLLVSLSITAQTLPLADLPQAAFTMPLDQPMPLDPKVTTGTLRNGLRYYIRENKEPVNRAELRLVINAGSLLESDAQLGLAHVLEHMAFNGTKRFPKQHIVRFVEGIGMRFGADLNASTSFDETIYQLQVPTDHPEYLAKALQVMEDWAHGMTLDPKEIDAERAVVAEEWRRGLGASNRISRQVYPVLLKGSRYPDRFPIGTIESIEHFDHAQLRQFYRDWYRPDLMAVIVVGDFDKTAVEKQVRAQFSRMPAARRAKARPQFAVAAHAGTAFVVASDAEISATSVSVQRKLPADRDWTPNGTRRKTVETFYNLMLTRRFQEMARQPNAPFLAAQSGKGSMVREAGLYQLSAGVQPSGIQRGLEALLTEAERVRRHGFTQPEFDRAKVDAQRALEQFYARRTNRTSTSHAAEMVRAFLTGESIPGVEFEAALQARFLGTITLAEVNRIGADWLTDDNRVVVVTLPKKEGLTPPTEAELRGVMASVSNADIKPYVDNTNDAPLLAAKPVGAPVKSTRTLNGGITEWLLGNGVRVAVKPTDFRKEQIVFTAVSVGGSSLAGDADYIPASTAASVIVNGGLGAFNGVDLQRKLTGKVVSATPFISDYEEGMQGSAAPADLETLLQLIYLRFTAPRADPAIFQVMQTQMATALQNRLAVPANVYGDAFIRLMYQNHPRRQPPTPELPQQLDLAKSLAFYKDRFADAGDFTFVFVGDIDVEKFRPLAETYLGGLPAAGRKESWKDVGIRVVQGVKDETIRRGVDPKSTTRIVFNGTMKALDTMERMRLRASTEILQNRLRAVLREQLGGTYSVSVGSQANWRPQESYTITIEFGSAPDRVDELLRAIQAELASFKQNGPTQVELANVKAAVLRNHETSLRENGSWMSQLTYTYSSGQNNGVDNMLAVPQYVERLSLESLRDAFRQYYGENNRVRMSLLPEVVQ
jgi:zinc protease